MSLVSSHRATTSSRTPGKVNTGTVRFMACALIVCDDCGGKVLDLVQPGHHGTRFVLNSRGAHVRVNCVGLPILEAP